MNAPLDHFETHLLTALRAHVADRAPAVRDDRRAPELVAGARRSPRLLLAGLGSGIAATAAVVFLPGLGATPAYSVQEGNAGTIEVQVNRFEDAPGLEKALAAYGIDAQITYLPDGATCAPGRYTPVDSAGGIALRMGSDLFRITLDPGTVRDGETLVIDASLVRLPDSADAGSGTVQTGGINVYVSAEVARGPVPACVPVPRTS